jgi:hypothetical protein
LHRRCSRQLRQQRHNRGSERFVIVEHQGLARVEPQLTWGIDVPGTQILAPRSLTIFLCISREKYLRINSTSDRLVGQVHMRGSDYETSERAKSPDPIVPFRACLRW